MKRGEGEDGTGSGCTDEGQEAREEDDDDERLEHNSSSSSQFLRRSDIRLTISTRLRR